MWIKGEIINLYIITWIIYQFYAFDKYACTCMLGVHLFNFSCVKRDIYWLKEHAKMLIELPLYYFSLPFNTFLFFILYFSIFLKYKCTVLWPIICTQHCVFTTSRQVFIHHCLPHLYPPPVALQPCHHHTVVQVLEFSLFCLFCSIPLLPSPPDSYQPAIYESVSIFLISSFSSLDSTLEWNHIVLVFFWLAYFT